MKWFCRGLFFFSRDGRSVEEERRSHASAVLVEEDVFGENPPSSDAVMNATSRHACTANGS